MSWSSPRQRSRSKGHKNKIQNFRSPQVRLPNYLSAWPEVKLPKPPTSASKAEPSFKPLNTEGTGSIVAKPLQSPPKREMTEKPEASSPTTKSKANLSLSDEEENDDTADSSTGDSQYQLADEGSFTKERSGSNLTREMDELSSGSDCEITDNEAGDSKQDGSQPTLEEGTSECKDLLRDATASQKRDKTAGRKRNKDKGGSENVFDARSPEKETSDIVNGNENATQGRNHEKNMVRPITDFLRSLEEDMGYPHVKCLDTPSPQSPAQLRTTRNGNVAMKEVPARSKSTEASNKEQAGHRGTMASQRGHDNSAALTEAQLQANLLQRRGHREFSSKAFDQSDNEQDYDLITKRKNNKGQKVENSLDPVGAEVAKQQARLKAHSAKKMKENSQRFLKKEDNEVYELTSDDELDQDGRTSAAEGSYRSRDAAAPSPSSREQAKGKSVTKKDKKRKKRKRDRTDEDVKEEDHNEKRRKKSKVDSEDDEDLSQTEAEVVYAALRNLQNFVEKATARKPKDEASVAIKDKIQKQVNAMRRPSKKDNPTALDYHKSRDEAELSAVLKSLWGLLPKALLHATMRELNIANRISMEERLRLCKKGKQTNPNIRVVQQIDKHGIEVDLLEEYDVISEPDRYTMSSDLTLLTAARSLIMLLSGQRTGLNIPAIVDKALEQKDDSTAGDLKKRTQDLAKPGGISPVEDELRRIASERQKEVEKLREENRILLAKVKRSK